MGWLLSLLRSARRPFITVIGDLLFAAAAWIATETLNQTPHQRPLLLKGLLSEHMVALFSLRREFMRLRTRNNLESRGDIRTACCNQHRTRRSGNDALTRSIPPIPVGQGISGRAQDEQILFCRRTVVQNLVDWLPLAHHDLRRAKQLGFSPSGKWQPRNYRFRSGQPCI